MRRRTWHRLAIWLPAAGTAAAGAVVFAVMATVDDPTTDQPERFFGGIIFGSPFLFLLLVQVACALYVGDRTGGPRWRGLLGISLSAALGSALVVWVVVEHAARGYPWEQFGLVAATLLALLVLPLPPAWAAQGERREAS